jgi:CRP/FNR family transcriptional regulator, dissimilatory nitrate respiration regulator
MLMPAWPYPPRVQVGIAFLTATSPARYTPVMDPIKSPCHLAKEFSLFANLDEAGCSQVTAYGRVQKYRKGQLLFQEGEPAKGLFLIRSGAVKIFKESESGREQILSILRTGDSVAELPLFDNQPYPASAAAQEDTNLLFIPRAAFEELLGRNPKLAPAVIGALAKRMRTLVELIADLSLRQVRQRLARYLLEEASRQGGKFRLELTNEELAARLGSVRDVISRTLSGLQNDGLILVQGRTIEILDGKKLGEEAA